MNRNAGKYPAHLLGGADGCMMNKCVKKACRIRPGDKKYNSADREDPEIVGQPDESICL
jgi:hypothetical protein